MYILLSNLKKFKQFTLTGLRTSPTFINPCHKAPLEAAEGMGGARALLLFISGPPQDGQHAPGSFLWPTML